MTVKFYVYKYKKDKDDYAPFEVQICANNTKAKFTLSHKVKYFLWDNKKQSFSADAIYVLTNLKDFSKVDMKTGEKTPLESKFQVSKMVSYEQILKHLEAVRLKLYDCENKLLELGYSINAQIVKEMYQGKIKGKQHGFTAYYQSFLEVKKQRIGKGIKLDTYKKYEYAFNHFKKFLKKRYKRDDIQLMEINITMIEAFFSYLLDAVPMKNNSAVGVTKKLKAVINQAFNDGTIQSNPMSNFKTSLDDTEIIYLTKEEVSRIYHKDIENERLGKIRDLFVFSCFTALSYVDQKKLEKKHIKRDGDNVYILMERNKTDVPATIPLLPEALEILEKYNYKLPVPSNQKYNAYLKELQDICNIKTELHTHICRHTCATLMLNNGVPLTTVSKILGHSKTKETEKTYAKFLPSTIISDVNNVAHKLRL